MAKVVLTRKQIAVDPNVFWNAFIDVIGVGEDEPRTPLQQHCHLCFLYYGEIMNGGHLQFLVNNGFDYAQNVLASLHGLGLTQAAKILEDAFDVVSTHAWKEIKSIEDYIEVALDDPFERQDDDFYSLSPDLLELLQGIALKQKDEFFTIIP